MRFASEHGVINPASRDNSTNASYSRRVSLPQAYAG